MFAAFRITAVIGLIFYFSPLRQPFQLPSWFGGSFGAAETPKGTSLHEPWRALPEQAKQALLEHIVADALGARPSRDAAAETPSPRDTLELEDLQPPWRGDGASGRELRRTSEASPRAQRGHGDKPRL